MSQAARAPQLSKEESDLLQETCTFVKENKNQISVTISKKLVLVLQQYPKALRKYFRSFLEERQRGHVDFLWNQSESISDVELAQILQELVGTPVTHVSFNKCLIKNTAKELELMLQQGLRGTCVTHVDFSGSWFDIKSGKEFAQMLKGFVGTSVTHVNFSRIGLAYKPEHELEMLQGLINSSVTHLNLSGNYLAYKNAEELALMLQGLVNTPVNHLDLSSNNLGRFNLDDLKKVFRAIPPSILSVNLLDNGFEKFTSCELRELLLEMPGYRVKEKLIGIVNSSLWNGMQRKNEPTPFDKLLYANPLSDPRILMLFTRFSRNTQVDEGTERLAKR